MANRASNLQPAALVFDHPEEVQRQNVADTHDHHEQRRRRNAETLVQDAQVRADESKGNHQLEDQHRSLREGVEDGDEAVDRVEREGGDGCDVAG